MRDTFGTKNNWFERNPLKAIAIIIFIFLLAIFIITECALSYKTDNNKHYTLTRSIRLREYQPFTYIYDKPNIEYMKTCNSLVYKPYLLRVDENGFIMPSKIHDSPDLVIAFLGGSTTECLYVTENNRFPYLVGRNIENETGLKVNSYNCGVSGNNSFDSINILLNKVLSIKPNLVIMMHNINDLIILLHEKTYWNKNPYRSNIIEEKPPSIRIILKQIKDLTIPNTYSAVSSLIPFILGTRQQIDEFQNVRNTKIVINRSHLLEEFKSNLLTFINICFSRKVTPVLMTQPNRLSEFLSNKPLMGDAFICLMLKHGISLDQFIEIFELFNQAIRDVGKLKNVKVIDLDRKVPHQKEYIYDTFHYNDNGSIFIAKLVSTELFPLINSKATR